MLSSQLVFAATLIILSECCLVLSGMIIRQLGGALPIEEVVLFRNLFGLVLLLPWLIKNGSSALHTKNLRFHLLRATIGVTAMSCLYYSWQQLPLAQAALLKQTAPFFMPLIAFWWLRERITVLARWAIAVGFAGVFLVLSPGEGVLNHAVLIALCGAMLGGCAKVVVRRMSSAESPQRIVFYFAFFSTLIALLPASFSWITPTLEQLGWLVLMSISSTLAQLLLSRAYGLAPAGQLGPFTYTSVAFAALFGWLLWDELLSAMAWGGVALICGAGVMAMQGDSKKSSSTEKAI